MSEVSEIRAQLAKSLDWQEARARFDMSVKDLPPDLRGRRPAGIEHTIWEQVEHIRIAQHDILDFCRNANYAEMKWPDDYWPKKTETSPSDDEWKASLAAYDRDLKDLQALTVDDSIDILAKIPHGSGQTYLREVLLVLDHTAYHVGQIVVVRKALGAWS